MGELVLGIDIGGTKTAVGAVDGDGRVHAARVAPTPARYGAAAILDTAATLADEVRHAVRRPVVAVGVGAPGVVDARRGVVVSATELLRGWAGTPVADLLAARLDLPVAVDNDVRAAGLGEARHGAGRAAGLALVVAVGTGIGGALVRAGVLLPGASGVAGHLGHIVVPGAGAEVCSCGRRDHLESVAAGPAILRAAQRAGLAVDSTAQVVALAATDARAASVVAEAASVLGRALGGLVNVLDPDIVVLAGGVAEAGAVWWQPLREAFTGQLLPPAAPALVPASLGTQAGVVGAAALAHDLLAPDLLHRDPASRDPASRDPASRDLASRDLASRDPASRDLASRDLASHDLADRDLADRDLPDRDLPDRDLPDRVLLARDLPGREPLHGRTLR